MKNANIGMVDGGNGPRFTLETVSKIGLVGKMLRKNLDRHRAVKTRVARPIHFSHAASSNRSQDLVRTELCACSQSHDSEAYRTRIVSGRITRNRKIGTVSIGIHLS